MTTGTTPQQVDANDVWLAIAELRRDVATVSSFMPALDARLDGMERRMDGMERRMDRLSNRVDKLIIAIIGGSAVVTAALIGAATALIIAT